MQIMLNYNYLYDWLGGMLLDKKYLYRTVRFIIVIAIIVFTLLSFYYLSKVTYPFLIALVIAFFINPIVTTFEKKLRMPRGLAVFVALIIIFAHFCRLSYTVGC